MPVCIRHAARFGSQDEAAGQKRLGDELSKNKKEQSKTEYEKDTYVEKRSSETQKKSVKDSSKGVATLVVEEGLSSQMKDSRALCGTYHCL